MASFRPYFPISGVPRKCKTAISILPLRRTQGGQAAGRQVEPDADDPTTSSSVPKQRQRFQLNRIYRPRLLETIQPRFVRPSIRHVMDVTDNGHYAHPSSYEQQRITARHFRDLHFLYAELVPAYFRNTERPEWLALESFSTSTIMVGTASDAFDSRLHSAISVCGQKFLLSFTRT